MILFINITIIFLLLKQELYECSVNTEMDLERQLLDHMNEKQYKAFIRPSEDGDLTEKEIKSIYGNEVDAGDKKHQITTVKVNLIIDELEDIRETENDFILTLTLVLKWRDKRLILKNSSFPFLSLTYFKSKIWRPDLYFYNTKEIFTFTHNHALLWLYPDGTIVSSEQIRLSLYCRMYLWRFPLDNQNCQIILGSHGYPTEDMKLLWRYTTFNQVNKNLVFQSKFDKEFNHPKTKIKFNHSYVTSTGKFSVLSVYLEFQRNCVYHLIYTFLPSSLIVFVSWMSFYIDHKAVPGRVPFCLLTLLAILTQWSNINGTLPKVSYLKAIDVWMFICLLFIILCLFEYAFVNNVHLRLEKAKAQLPKEIQKIIKSELVDFARCITLPETAVVQRKKRTLSWTTRFPKLSATRETYTNKSFNKELVDEYINNKQCTESALHLKNQPLFYPEDIDRMSRYVFPFLFIIVNIIFWATLTYHD